MATAIGIDTGGTYTDGVLVDVETKRILKTAKTETTHEDLRICIANVLDDLTKDKQEGIKLVSLSTTLATNACVENRGAKTRLILFGSSPKDIDEYGLRVGLPDAREVYFAEGAVDYNGDIVEEPNWDAFQRDVLEFKESYEAYAIVSLWSMTNPVLEMRAKEIVESICNKPVVCGHELSSQLNYLRRAVSAYLNARLTPIFCEFSDCVKAELIDRGIDARLMIVSGDGTMMSEEYARHKPVETLLSGPAASALGASELCPDVNNAVVVDIGGTTTDLAIIESGFAVRCDDGAVVGGFKTLTKTIDIDTIALGGDSELMINSEGVLRLGTRKIKPICALAATYPEIRAKLAKPEIRTEHLMLSEIEFYYLTPTDKPAGRKLEARQKAIISLLEQGPMTIAEITKVLDYKSLKQDLNTLTYDGLIMKSGLTPTDAMHVNGDFGEWDIEASQLAIQHVANRLGRSVQAICDEIYDCVMYRLFALISSRLLRLEGITSSAGESALLDKMIAHAFAGGHKYLDLFPSSDFLIIGIGAPTHVFVPRLAQLIGARTEVPENAGIGNAIGAILGRIASSFSIELRKHGNGYIAIDKYGTKHYEQNYRQACALAKELAIKTAEEDFFARGGIEPSIQVVENIDSNESALESSIMVYRYAVTASAYCDILKLA